MTKDPLTHALIGHAMKTHRDLGPELGEEFIHQNFSSHPISKAIIPQIQGQPQMETELKSLILCSGASIADWHESSWLPE